MRNWADVLPQKTADLQTAYERRQLVLRLRKAGLTLKEIGLRMNLSTGRVRELECKARQDTISPIEHYFTIDSDLRSVAEFKPYIRKPYVRSTIGA